MADDPDPPRPQRKPSGNSAEALRALLERHGLHELLEEVDRHRGLTLFGACCEAGLRKRPEPVGGGSQNAARTRAFFFNRALMAAERADAHQGVQPRVQPPVQRPPRIRRSAPDAMPDLAAACAEAFDRPRERAPRPRVTTRMRPPEIVTDDGEHALLRHALTQAEAEIARLQDAAADGRFAHPAFPCGSCSSTCADAAMAEVINVYIAARRGELNLVGNVLPKSCCQRQLRCVDARALIA